MNGWVTCALIRCGEMYWSFAGQGLASGGYMSPSAGGKVSVWFVDICVQIFAVKIAGVLQV